MLNQRGCPRASIRSKQSSSTGRVFGSGGGARLPDFNERNLKYTTPSNPAFKAYALNKKSGAHRLRRQHPSPNKNSPQLRWGIFSSVAGAGLEPATSRL